MKSVYCLLRLAAAIACSCAVSGLPDELEGCVGTDALGGCVLW